MRNRLWYVFRKPSVHVKPIAPGIASELSGWATLELNTLESFTDDRKRYGLRIAFVNFVGTVAWRWRGYSNGRR